ncbi:MAG: transcription termination factor Rho [Coriobacteriaceae bacterium]|nr:transcription termination factor Rho [Coriobacteriaceae bacterium]
MIEPQNGFEQAAESKTSVPASDPAAASAPAAAGSRVSAKRTAAAETYVPAYARSSVEAKREAEGYIPAYARSSAALNAQAQSQAGGTAAGSGDEAPSAKSRTRKPRVAKESDSRETAENAGSAADTVDALKPRRGRPRKVKVDPTASEQAPDASAQAQEEAPKPRRGRPRKNPLPAEAPAAADAVKADASSQDADAPKPRRRKKADAEQPADAALQGESGVQANEGRVAVEAQSDSESHEAPVERESQQEAFREDAEGRFERSENEAEDGREDDEERASRNQYENGKKRGKKDRQKRDRERDRDRERRNGKEYDRDRRRQRRQHQQGQNREPIVPKTTAEDLAKLKVVELRQKADELGVNHKGLLKADLVAAVLEASIRKEGFVEVEGVLDILADGYGFLRTEGYLPSEHDVYVGASVIRRNGLRKGDFVKGQIRPKRDNEKFAAIQRIDTVNETVLDDLGKRPRFADLTPVYPDERLLMEHGKSAITARVIDLAAPIGKGQRGLIVSPPKAGKTTVLKDIAASITANNPEVHLICLLVDERPEEVTDMQRSIKGEVVSSTFDMPSENHIAVAEMVIERAKRLVENGRDVVILLDSITRLARAYNLAQPASGRILSGGVDSTALYPPKRFLGAARNIEGGGSLTILASALIDTGSKMDEVIFEEFKGTGNMELKLDRNLADRRIFPAIDPVSSGTRKEELLLDPQEAPLIWAVRRILSNMNNPERAMDMLIKSLKQTDTNQAFLLRTAKKAQTAHSGEHIEL